MVKAKVVKAKKTPSQIGKSSKNKGKVGEREFCKFMHKHGMDAQRTVQYKGTGSSADIESSGLRGIHPEVKRTESVAFYSWYEQASKDAAGTDRAPVIFHRKNKGKWMAFIAADVLLELIKKGHC